MEPKCGLMFLERCACVSSLAIEAAMTGPQCKGEGRGEMRDVQGSSMKVSPLFIPFVNHQEVFEMDGECQVKGRKTYLLLAAASFPCISLSSVFKLLGFPLSIAVC